MPVFLKHCKYLLCKLLVLCPESTKLTENTMEKAQLSAVDSLSVTADIKLGPSLCVFVHLPLYFIEKFTIILKSVSLEASFSFVYSGK